MEETELSLPTAGSVDLDEAKSAVARKARHKKEKPTFFLAMRITDDNIRSNVAEFQNQFRAWDPKLKNQAFIKPYKLHTTLFVLPIATKDQFNSVLSALQKISQHDNLTQIPKYIELKGLKHFGRKVIWMNCVDDANIFTQSIENIKSFFKKEVGKDIQLEKKPFVAHATVIKIRSKAKLDIEQYQRSEWNEKHFGTQKLHEIELLCMDQHDESGYYKCFARLSLDQQTLHICGTWEEYISKVKYNKTERRKKNLLAIDAWVERMPNQYNSLLYWNALRC